MTFTLHPNLATKLFVIDLPLCRVLMEDEKHYRWFILVPRKPNISRLIDLTDTDQHQLTQEQNLMQKILWEQFQPTQLNVAAIGNKTPQLHIHVIARYNNDPAWPHTVWDHPVRAKLSPSEANEIIQVVRKEVNVFN